VVHIAHYSKYQTQFIAELIIIAINSRITEYYYEEIFLT